jgi:hypothetical protein
MFADRKTLFDLTGYQRPAATRRWLDRERIPYMIGSDGWPRVLQSVILERLGGLPTSVPANPEPRLRLRHS